MTKLHIIHRSAMTQMLIIAAKAIKNARVTQKSKTDLRVTFLFYNDRKVRRVRVMGWGDINK